MPKEPAAPHRMVSFRLLEDLYLQAREAAYRERTSVSAQVEDMLEDWVRKCWKRYNDGKPFDVDPEDLPPATQRPRKKPLK
jgi:hypothetical protein